MIQKFKEFINEGQATARLYHGAKGAGFKEFDFKSFPYFYLTDSDGYAGTYGDVLAFNVDTSGFLDLTGFGTEQLDFKSTQAKFHKLTGLYFPSDMAKTTSLATRYALWERVRMDTAGLLKKRLLSTGVHGFIMKEKANRTVGGAPREYTVHVLLDNTPLR